MKLSRHAVPEWNVALLGDAVSGVYSKLGQGCALVLFTSSVLAEQLALARRKNETTTSTIRDALNIFFTSQRQRRTQPRGS